LLGAEMAIYPAPMLVLAPALIVNLVIALRAGWQRKGPNTRPGMRLPVAAGLALVVFSACTFGWFDSWERRMPVLLGLTLGVLLGLLWEWACPAHQDDSADLGPLAGGLATLALIGLLLAPGVPFANAALGVMAGWGVLQMLAVLMPRDNHLLAPYHGGTGLATVGLVAGASAWGARLPIHTGVEISGLWPLAIGLATLAVLGLTAAALAGERRGGATGAAIAAVIFVVGGLALAGAPFQQPSTLLAGLAAGAAAGVFASIWLPEDGATPPITALIFLVVLGGVLVLENRLMGILAIGLGGIGLLTGAAGRSGPRHLVAVAIAIFASRVWLQLFLDRTNLTGYGVDLTHPYAFAALIVGGLLPTAAIAIAQYCRPVPTLSVGWALTLALLPAWLGYMVHVEALGGLLSGLVLATFTLAAREDEEVGAARSTLVAALPALLLVTLAVTMLAAPWLVGHMNAPRDERTYWFLASLTVAILAMGRWWWSMRQMQVA
jgi:hypothetical protein